MNTTLVDAIANAVLYEGYILYPYRPSVKNRQRWTIGGLYPRSYSMAQGGHDAWTMRTECLVQGNRRTTIAVQSRFLHLLVRFVGELAQPVTALPSGAEPAYRVVETLQVGDQQFFTWQEAVERTVRVDDLVLDDLSDQTRLQGFAFPAHRAWESLRDSQGTIVGVLVREQHAVEGALEVSSESVEDGLFKLSARVVNLTPLEDAGRKSRDEAVLRSLASAHTVLRVREGAFVSLLEPPDRWRAIAARCRNEGTWPVLVGEAGQRDTMLSSPIILYDYPQIAPESAGDLFDATEIDEILSLRILTLTDREKRMMAAVDERARALLQRTEALAPGQLLGLHGTVRGLRTLPAEDDHE
jgi:hydrogenase maturation protease